MTESERTRLEADLEQDEEEVKRLCRRLEQKPDFGHGRGTARGHAWEMDLVRKQKIEARVTDLRRALDRLRDRAYGLCRHCGASINPDRIEILPATTLCVACARALTASPAGRTAAVHTIVVK